MSLFPVRLLRDWDIPATASVSLPESGTMNETWLLEWPRDRAVLRRHRRSVRADIEFEHRVLAHARLGGTPCPTIIPTSRGESFVEDDGRFYSLYTWAAGSQIPRGHLGPQHARSMGSMLAHIHLVLGDLAGGPEANDPIGRPGHTLGRIDELIQCARARSDQPRLNWLIDDLTARSRWLSVHQPRPATRSAGTAQVIHGDYLDTNVFFARGKVSCVIDWDKARREIPARELVRAMDHALGMEPSLCQQFLAGYRSVGTMATDQLEEAAEWFSHQQAHSLWLIEQILVQNNDRVESLIKPFRPFSELWTRATLI